MHAYKFRAHSIVGMQDRQKRRARAGLVHVSRVTPGEYRSCTSHASKTEQKRERTRVVLVACSRSFRADVRDILEEKAKRNLC